MPTLEQKRARFALLSVRGVTANKGDYLIELRRLPANLHTMGLGQTVAMLLASSNDKSGTRLQICRWLEEWLKQPPIAYPAQPLIDSITGVGDDAAGTVQSKYAAASREARALAVWLKKFAEAFLREPKPAGGADAHTAAAPTA